MKELRKWLIIAGVVGVVGMLGKLYNWHLEIVAKAEQAIITEYDQQGVKDMEEQLQLSQDLFDATLKDYKEYATKVNNDNTRLQHTIDGLRQRPSRTTVIQSVTDTPTCEATGTGAGLYREDAEFLIREAARANSVVAERDYYYSAYTRAEAKLKELNVKD